MASKKPAAKKATVKKSVPATKPGKPAAAKKAGKPVFKV